MISQEQVDRGWRLVRLGDITEISTGGTPRRNCPEFWGGQVPWVTTSKVNQCVVTGADEWITHEGLSNCASRLYGKGTLLMAMYGQGATRGRVAILGMDAAINQACAAIKAHGCVNTHYLFHYLAHRYGAIRNLSHTGNQENLNISIVGSIPILLPPTAEQAKMAAVLSTWDRAIDLTSRLIETKKVFRKGVMQQALTGRLRFREFREQDWIQVALGRVFRERNETSQPDLPLLAITADQGVMLRDGLDKRDTSSEDKTNYKRIAPGDIGYNTMRMWQGRSALSSLEGLVSPAYTVCIPQDGIEPRFAAQLFNLPEVVHKFWRHSQGLVSDTLNLKFHQFAKVRVMLPSVEEQRKIAMVLDAIDYEISLLDKQLAAFKAQKKGLMQKLLTGQIRVKL